MESSFCEPLWETDETRIFRNSVRRFVEAEFAPVQDEWRKRKGPGAEAWKKAGSAGLLLADVPMDYGGGGGNFANEIIVCEELANAGVHFGCSIQGIVARYILSYGSEEQKRRWMPDMARGNLIAAIAMTEPGTGSDLPSIRTTARPDGDHYVINGSKTFVSNGTLANLICLAAKTDTNVAPFRGISMIIVETADLPGYKVGSPLEKVGMQGQDTCELFFDDVHVPKANLLGRSEGHGLVQMTEQLPYERLTIAAKALTTAERALTLTTGYVKERAAFGQPIIDFQNTRFKLAECKTETHIGRVFLNDCIQRCVMGKIDDLTAAMAKLWFTDTEWKIVDTCAQLHGGYGYMLEYAIARIWTDSRVQRIYGGTNEIMHEIIASTL